MSNAFAAGSFKTDVSNERRTNGAARRGKPVRLGRARRGRAFLLVLAISAALAGCGEASSKSPPAEAGGATGAAREVNEEVSAENQEETAEALKNRELLSLLEAKKREEAAETEAKSTERTAAEKAKKQEAKAKKTEQEAKKREAQAIAKAKRQEEQLKAEADKQREAAKKREAEVKKREAERVAAQKTTTTTAPVTPPPSAETGP